SRTIYLGVRIAEFRYWVGFLVVNRFQKHRLGGELPMYTASSLSASATKLKGLLLR
ncbi:hypothetical protein J6590_023974, partial [Homalodisca vitripennis]